MLISTHIFGDFRYVCVKQVCNGMNCIQLYVEGIFRAFSDIGILSVVQKIVLGKMSNVVCVCILLEDKHQAAEWAEGETDASHNSIHFLLRWIWLRCDGGKFANRYDGMFCFHIPQMITHPWIYAICNGSQCS